MGTHGHVLRHDQRVSLELLKIASQKGGEICSRLWRAQGALDECAPDGESHGSVRFSAQYPVVRCRPHSSLLPPRVNARGSVGSRCQLSCDLGSFDASSAVRLPTAIRREIHANAWFGSRAQSNTDSESAPGAI